MVPEMNSGNEYKPELYCSYNCNLLLIFRMNSLYYKPIVMPTITHDNEPFHFNLVANRNLPAYRAQYVFIELCAKL